METVWKDFAGRIQLVGEPLLLFMATMADLFSDVRRC